jgi:hypothetical protein
MKIKSIIADYHGDEHGVWVQITVEAVDGAAFRVSIRRDEDDTMSASFVAMALHALGNQIYDACVRTRVEEP